MADKLSAAQKKLRVVREAKAKALAEAKRLERDAEKQEQEALKQTYLVLGKIVCEVVGDDVTEDELREVLRQGAIRHGIAPPAASVVRDAAGEIVGAHLVSDEEADAWQQRTRQATGR